MFRNTTNVPLPLAVWLAESNTYDRKPAPDVFGVTEILKSIRQIVLTKRVPEQADNDLINVVPSAIGTAVHSAAEMAWLYRYQQGMKALGYSDEVIAKVKVNPDRNDPGPHNIFVEQRTEKQVGKYTISGKFDFVVEGQLHDIKTTSTYSWIKGSNDLRYVQQGSLYRWLNEDIVTSNELVINYVFTDWSAIKAQADPAYPQQRIQGKKYELIPVPQVIAHVEEKLRLYDQFKDTPEPDLPKCNRVELWQDPSTWAYYSDPKNTRATKVFDSEHDARLHQAQQGKGIIKEREGEPAACRYCSARDICGQAARFVMEGLLKF